MTLTGCLYGRNSQAEEKSIEDQLREGHDDATQAGIKIVAEYNDGLTASWFADKGRDGWAQVLADVEAKRWDVLVLWEPSRGDRSPETWGALIRLCATKGILIRSIRDERTYDPRIFRDAETLLQDGLDAWRESMKTSARVKKGVRGAVANGTPLGREQFGYTRIKDKRGKVTGQVPDDNAPIVAKIFEMLADGVPGSQVARTMNAKGYRTSTGGQFTNAHIRDIGRRRAYIGDRRTPGGDWTPGGWAPIVEESVFWSVQRIMDQRAEKDADGKRGREGKIVWLLSGIAQCGVCGAFVAGSRARGMYIPACGHVAIVATDLDEYVTQVVLALLSRPDVYGSLRQAGQDSDAAVVAARNEVARLQAKLENAKDLWEADRLDAADYADMAARLKPKIQEAQEKVSRAAVPPAVRGLVAPGEDVTARWGQMPLAARRDVIRTLMNVVVDRSQIVDGGWLEVEDRVRITPK